MAYERSMRKLLIALSMVGLLAGCAHGPYESVFEDGGFRLSEREFNTGNSGTDVCPGELFGHASQGSAYCGSAPQQCVAGATNGAPTLRCFCSPISDAGTGRGRWSCM
ncbi:MAG: hypothetical protein Q8Q09_07860 [Deltaproteobacteria bacterium]|nr:hypothetical protein [Deltaproteobacteria bacterium]